MTLRGLHDVLSTAMLVLDGDARCQAATRDTSDGAAVKIVRSVTGGGLPPCIPIENQPPP